MIALPVRREAAPVAVRTAAARGRGATAEDTLEQRIGSAVDAALAEALAKVSTPEDQELAKQQQAFDQMTALRAEQQREANVIRDMAMEQLKRDEDVLKKWIDMI